MQVFSQSQQFRLTFCLSPLFYCQSRPVPKYLSFVLRYSQQQQIIFIMKSRHEQSPPNLRHLVSFSQTFQSSQNEKAEKFTIDKSIARGINQNKSSIIIDQQNDRVPIDSQQLDQEQEMDKTLLEYRVKYDRVRLESFNLQKKIKQEKEEHQRLQEEHEKLSIGKRDANSTCKQTQKQLEQFTYEVDQLLLNHDCYKEMQERLKSDILYYRKKIFDGNLELMKKKSELNRQSAQSNRQKRLSIRCRTLLTSVEKTYHQNELERSNGLQTVKNVLTSKKQHCIKLKQREYELQKSMEYALCEKLPFQKQYLHLLYSNKLVKSILHFKMESEMKKYQQISNAFNQIKSNSTVKNADEFVYKFMNKNQIYGSLLESISKLQPQISDLEEERKQLEAISFNLTIQSEQIAEMFKNKHQQETDKSAEEIEKLNNRLQAITKLRNGWTMWAQSTMAMFRGVPRSEIRARYDDLGSLLGDSLRMILKYINHPQEKQTSISEQALAKQATKAKVQPQELLTRNIRIKTLGNEMSHRDDDVEYDLVSEKDFLHLARRAIKKQRLTKNKVLSKP